MLLGAYFYIGPKDLSQRTLGQLTVGEITGNVGFLVFIVVWVRALCNPMDDEKVKDAWGWLGIAMFCLGLVALIVFGRS